MAYCFALSMMHYMYIIIIDIIYYITLRSVYYHVVVINNVESCLKFKITIQYRAPHILCDYIVS